MSKERIGLLKYKGIRYSGDPVFKDISDIYHELLEMIELEEVTKEGALELFHDNALRVVSNRLNQIVDESIQRDHNRSKC